MKKKALFFTVLSLLAASSFAQNIHQRYLFIEGTAVNPEHYEFFMKNFALEAAGAGYIVTENKNSAAHTLNFDISTDTNTTNYQYIAKISLFRNEDGLEVTALNFYYNNINEVYDFTRTLFQNATLYIPILTTEELNAAQGLYNNWKNKWLYLRVAFNYPITFYLLNDDNLVGGQALYEGSFENPTAIDRLRHEVMATPGATVGAEFQFLDFMSLELNFQVSMGDTRTKNNLFINMAAGAELKFPIKLNNIVIAPYGAFTYHLNVSQAVFSDFPPFAFGGGIELSARAGANGAVFIDVNYTFSISDAVMYNPYLSLSQQYYPNPPVIHYNRSVIGIGIGYKFGIFDR